MKLSTQHYSHGAYIRIQTDRQDMSIRLDDNCTVQDSLLSHAGELRLKANRLMLNADIIGQAGFD